MTKLNKILTLGVFQLICLILFIFYASIPLYFGSLVKLKVKPIDPRDLMRGNYVALQYDISEVSKDLADDHLKSAKLIDGATVYVLLAENGDFYEAKKISLSPFKEGFYIKGNLRYTIKEIFHIKYGIEAYFMPKDRALEAEKTLRKGDSLAKVYLFHGRSSIAGLLLPQD